LPAHGNHLQVILSDNDPLLGIGQVQILLSSRPSPWDWSSPNPPLLMTLSLGMVRSLCSPFGQQPSPWDWSSPNPPFLTTLSLEWSSPDIDHLHWNGHWSPYGYIMTLCKVTVIDFCVTSRPSTKQWSLISSHHDPLQGNSHWYLCHIETLFIEMVIDFSSSRPSPWDWPNLFWVVTLFSVIATKSFWGLNLDPLHRIGHRTRLIPFYSPFSSSKSKQNLCIYLYLSFTIKQWKVNFQIT